MARGLGLPDQLRGPDAVRRSLPLPGSVRRSAATPANAARSGCPRPLRQSLRQGGRSSRRAHPLRPRGRRPGDRPPLRLQRLRLRLAGHADGPARARRPGGRGRALLDLRAGPFRGQLHPQRPLEAVAGAGRPLRRRPHLRAPRRALALRLSLRPGLGDLDQGRRPPLLPPGQRQPDRRSRSASARSTSSSPASPAATSPATTGSESSPASTPASSSPPTTTTSSARSGSRSSSSPTSSSQRCQTRSARSAPTPRSPPSPAPTARRG